MNAVFLPSSPKALDYYMAGLVYIASGPNTIRMEDEENPSNLWSREIKENVKKTLESKVARKKVRMCIKHNMLDAVINGDEKPEEKVKRVAIALKQLVY